MWIKRLFFKFCSSSDEDGPKSSSNPEDKKSSRARKLTYADMVVSAVHNIHDPKGASLPSIKNYLKEQYLIDEVTM